jgi:CRP/FNR family transcriptional regulator, cyclic AMP receptor protein
MPPPIDRDLLRRSLVLHGLAPGELELLAGMLHPRHYRKDATIFHQDDPGEELHLVVSGHLKVVVLSEEGEEAVLTVLGPGDLFGEMSLLDGGPRSATVVALEPSETYTLRRPDFRRLLGSSPAAVEGLLTALARMVRRLSSEVTDLMFLDMRGRLVKKLLELVSEHGRPADGGVEISVELTQEELAGMIGATRPRVNTLLGFFEDQGAISRRGRRLIIRSPERLRYWLSR